MVMGLELSVVVILFWTNNNKFQFILVREVFVQIPRQLLWFKREGGVYRYWHWIQLTDNCNFGHGAKDNGYSNTSQAVVFNLTNVN